MECIINFLSSHTLRVCVCSLEFPLLTVAYVSSILYRSQLLIAFLTLRRFVVHCSISLNESRAEKERAQTPPLNPDSKDCGILSCRPAFIQRFAGIKVRHSNT